MSKQKTKQRSVYAFKTTIDKFVSNGVQFGWGADSVNDLIELLQTITALPLEEKCLKDTNYAEWTMYLEKFEVDNIENPTYLKGYFYSTKDGLRTSLQNFDTGQIKTNPKEPGDNEIRTTCFAFRAKDGLFLLADYYDNVVTSSRISDYFNLFFKSLRNDLNVEQISFENLVSKEFLEKLNSFERINSLEITVDTTRRKDEIDDAISTINEELADLNQGKVTLVIQRADKYGLVKEGISTWVSDKLNKHTIIQGRIIGKPHPGNPRIASLKGVNEKYEQRFSVNMEGEVLLEPMFDFIISIINNRPKLV